MEKWCISSGCSNVDLIVGTLDCGEMRGICFVPFVYLFGELLLLFFSNLFLCVDCSSFTLLVEITDADERREELLQFRLVKVYSDNFTLYELRKRERESVFECLCYVQ